jgi:hypothetical protein
MKAEMTLGSAGLTACATGVGSVAGVRRSDRRGQGRKPLACPAGAERGPDMSGPYGAEDEEGQARREELR